MEAHQTVFHGVWGKSQDRYIPIDAKNRTSFLTSSIKRVQGQLQLRKENEEPSRRSNNSVVVVHGSPALPRITRIIEVKTDIVDSGAALAGPNGSGGRTCVQRI